MTRARQVMVLGAHPDSSRFSNKALLRLARNGFDPIPIHPRFKEILGRRCYPSISAWRAEHSSTEVDTLSFYLNATHSTAIQDEILALRPRRAIFNPGAENPALARALKSEGVEVLDACTLVLLDTGKF